MIARLICKLFGHKWETWVLMLCGVPGVTFERCARCGKEIR